MITIRPFGGLANRMRVIDSILLIAKRKDIKKIDVIWESSFELNCPFKELFIVPDILNVREIKISGFRKRFKEKITDILSRISVNIPLGYEKYLYNRDIERLINQNYDFEEISRYNSLYLSTTHRFYSNENMFTDFKPVHELQDKINKITSGFPDNTIGVHIRRTDNKKAIRYSPLSEYIRLIREEIEKNPDTCIFLAADCDEVKEILKDLFKEKIITYKRHNRRDYNYAIQEALIDLYSLANTKKILGSYWSSFTDVASQINDIRLIRVYKDQDK